MQQTIRFIIAIFLTGILCAFLLPETSEALAANSPETFWKAPRSDWWFRMSPGGV